MRRNKVINKSLGARCNRLWAKTQLGLDRIRKMTAWILLSLGVLAFLILTMLPQEEGYYRSSSISGRSRRRWREAREDELGPLLESLGVEHWRIPLLVTVFCGFAVLAVLKVVTIMRRDPDVSVRSAVSQLRVPKGGSSMNKGGSSINQVIADTIGTQQTRMAGKWTVNPDIVKYCYFESLGSFAGFKVEQEYRYSQVSSVSEDTTIWRTGAISGTVEISDSMLTAADIMIGIDAITADGVYNKKANQRWREALKAEIYPQAVFSLIEPVSLPAKASSRGSFFRADIGQPHDSRN